MRFDVLDRGWIELQNMMPSFDEHENPNAADMEVVSAARVSFLGESKGEMADKKLLKYMLRNGHTSPFEQVTFKFRVHAPLMVWWQWVRHRTWHYNAQSGRYTPFEENEMYVPEEWRKQSSSNKQGSEGVIDPLDAKVLSVRLQNQYLEQFKNYQMALDMGVAKELARVFLPGFSMYYTWVVSTDALNLMKWLKLRQAPDAQYEIRVYADIIYKEFFKPLMPWTCEAYDEYWRGSSLGG